MKKYLLLLLLIIHVQHLSAQTTFYKQYGQGQVQSGIDLYYTQQTYDGGYMMAGFIYPNSSDAQVYLVKTNDVGDTLWTKIIGGAVGFYMGTFAQQTADSGYVISGTYQSGAVYLIKTNTIGDTLWTKHYGNASSVFTGLQQTTDGGYIIVATNEAASGDVWLLKTDINGDTLWTKKYGGSNTEYGNSVQQTSDGGYIIAGETWSNTAGSSDAYLIKTDAAGDTLWTKKYGNTNGENAKEVKQTSDGGYVFCGGSSGQIYVVKTDANGNVIWQKFFGGISADESYSIKQTTDGGYVVAGKIEHFSSATSTYIDDACLLKLDANGTLKWNRNFGPLLGNPGSSFGNNVSLTSDGGFVLTGVNQLGFLIKTDSLGNILTTGISSENGAQNNFSTLIYPNPANDELTIDIENTIEKNMLAEIYDISGRLIQSETLNGNSKQIIAIQALEKGFYFIKINLNGKVSTIKFTKE